MTFSSLDFTQFSLSLNVLIFLGAGAVIAIAGWRIAYVAADVARRTGLGEAITGAVFLGASTSFPGTVTSITAAAGGHPELAYANAIGGISVQTAFLAIADMTYSRANLEHAAASVANIMQGALLVAMLGIILVAMTAPPVSFFGVHPVSLVLPVAYVYGTRLVAQVNTERMWVPQRTSETREDRPQKGHRFSGLGGLWARFAALATLVGGAGWLTARTGIVIAERSGLSESAVGTLFTAVSTSLPELVTCLAAVRQGALTLAVGDIIGGNVFDTLFVSLSDLAYRDGSLIHAAGRWGQFTTALPVLLTGILLMGLIRREKSGIANIGFESFFVLLLYLGAATLIVST